MRLSEEEETEKMVRKDSNNNFCSTPSIEGVDEDGNSKLVVSSVRSSYSHPDLLVIHPTTFSDHTGPQHWTFTF